MWKIQYRLHQTKSLQDAGDVERTSIHLSPFSIKDIDGDATCATLRTRSLKRLIGMPPPRGQLIDGRDLN